MFCKELLTSSGDKIYNIWKLKGSVKDFSSIQVFIMESGRQVIPMSLVPQHIYCKSTSATNNRGLSRVAIV